MLSEGHHSPLTPLKFLDKANLPKVDYSNLSDFKAIIDARGEAAAKALGEAPPQVKQSEVHYQT
jgi:hypothetical protein